MRRLLSSINEFLKSKVLPRRITRLLVLTVAKWQKDECLELGAALSYYSLFSIFPIALVIASILGFLLGPETEVFQRILTLARGYLPPPAFDTVQATLLKLNQQSVGAGTIGFLIAIFAASSLFSSLSRTVDKIWQTTAQQSRPSSVLSTTKSIVWKRLWAFALVIGSAFLLWLSLIANIAIRIVLEMVSQVDQTIAMVEINHWLLARGLQSISSFLLMVLAVLLLFRFLPSTTIRWRDLWPGAVLAAGLLLGLQQLVTNNIIQIGARYQSYGAIGGVMILMLWIYCTWQIFLLSCEFSYIYAYLFGSRRSQDLKI